MSMRDHGIAELHLLFLLERQRIHGIDDHLRQPGGIQHPFFQIELPGAVLLRHQPPLQPIGQLGGGVLQGDQLLIEQRPQADQLIGLAELLRAHDLVERFGVGVVVDV